MAREWSPTRPREPVPVGLARPGSYKRRPPTKYKDSVSWYRSDGANVEAFVFFSDSAGTWWELLQELWELTAAKHLDGDWGILEEIADHIEEECFPDDEGCIETRDNLLQLIEDLKGR